jgi:hypothetical protein
VTERERDRRLSVQGRLADLRAKYGHEDVWVAQMHAEMAALDAAPEPAECRLDQPLVQRHVCPPPPQANDEPSAVGAGSSQVKPALRRQPAIADFRDLDV